MHTRSIDLFVQRAVIRIRAVENGHAIVVVVAVLRVLIAIRIVRATSRIKRE